MQLLTRKMHIGAEWFWFRVAGRCRSRHTVLNDLVPAGFMYLCFERRIAIARVNEGIL